MGFQLTERDKVRLTGVHPHLVAVVTRAAEYCDETFIVVEGVRSWAKQVEYVNSGASKTFNSRHLMASNGYGHAVDLVIIENGKAMWNKADIHHKAMTRAAKELGYPLEWGGNWKGSWDSPHYQLPWASYPAKPTRRVNSVADLSGSRIMRGSMLAALPGTGVIIESGLGLVNSIQEAQERISTGDILGLIAGVLIVGGALYAAWARWQDAGAPTNLSDKSDANLLEKEDVERLRNESLDTNLKDK